VLQSAALSVDPTEQGALAMTTGQLAAKADLYLMLSRAFLPPTQADAHAAFVDILPEELRDAARDAGHALADEIAAYGLAAAAIPDHTALLQTYATLFLTPPREVQLHAAVYLDGAILGKSADALQLFYAKHGLARAEDFHDLPDHLAAILEFLALLYARAAEVDGYPRADLLNDATELNRHLLLSWVPVMRRHTAQIVAEGGVGQIYLALMTILQTALVADVGPLSEHLQRVLDPSLAPPPVQEDIRDMVKCRECGADIAPAARIRRVRKVLEKEGIDTSHLELCPRCRGVDMLPVGQALIA